MAYKCKANLLAFCRPRFSELRNLHISSYLFLQHPDKVDFIVLILHKRELKHKIVLAKQVRDRWSMKIRSQRCSMFLFLSFRNRKKWNFKNRTSVRVVCLVLCLPYQKGICLLLLGPRMKYAQIEKIKKQKYPGSAPTVGKMESKQAHRLYLADGKLLF